MHEYNFDNRIYYRKNEFIIGRLTLVFVHGVVGSSSAWLPYEKILESKYNILSYDIRGHGYSKKYPKYEDYEVKNFAEDLHDLVTYLGIDKFVLITNSFAALIALEYLKKYRSTVIANIFTSPEVYLHEGFLASVMRAFFKTTTAILSLLPFDLKPRGQVDYAKHIGSTDWDLGRNIADLRNTGLHAHFYTLGHSVLPEQEYELEKIYVPTLILHGEQDSMVPMKNAIRMSKEIKGAKFISIPKVDHNTVHNAVSAMSFAIDQFCATIPSWKIND